MANDEKTAAMGVLTQGSGEPGTVPEINLPDAGSLGGGPMFNWSNWGVWFIGLLIPGLLLVVVPFSKYVTQSDYTHGWFNDAFSNTSVAIISISMLLAARFELNAGIRDAVKTSVAKALEHILLSFLLVCVMIYVVYILAEADAKGSLLLTDRIAGINVALFITAFIMGTCSFIRGIMWKRP